MSENAVHNISSHDNEIRAEVSAGETIRIFRFPDRTIQVPGHSYIAPVKDCSLLVDPRGTWTLAYRLENSQWNGDLQLSIHLLTVDNKELHTAESLLSITCHMAHRASSGPYPAGLFDMIRRASFSYSGALRPC